MPDFDDDIRRVPFPAFEVLKVPLLERWTGRAVDRHWDASGLPELRRAHGSSIRIRQSSYSLESMTEMCAGSSRARRLLHVFIAAGLLQLQ